MFNIGTGEIVVIAVVALLVLGPKRLPELARGIGKFMREFRRQTDEVRGVVEREFYKMDQEINKPAPSPVIQPAAGTVPNLPASPGAPVAPLGAPPPGGLPTPAEAAPVGPTAAAGQLPVPGVDISDPSHPDHFGPQTPAPAPAPAMDISDPAHPEHFGPLPPSEEKKAG